MNHHIVLVAIGLVLGISTASLGACANGPNDFCSELAGAEGCSGETKSQCEAAISSAKAESAVCAPFVDALAECIAGLDLRCTGSSSISANGDGIIGGGQNFTDIGGNSVVVNDSACDEHRRGLEASRSCADAAGATVVGVLGVGDHCGPGDECAAGLSCTGAICTRSCSSDDECRARADGCALQFQYPNVCSDAGMCTRSCGDSYSCEVWIGPGSQCMDGACTL